MYWILLNESVKLCSWLFLDGWIPPSSSLPGLHVSGPMKPVSGGDKVATKIKVLKYITHMHIVSNNCLWWMFRLAFNYPPVAAPVYQHQMLSPTVQRRTRQLHPPLGQPWPCQSYVTVRSQERKGVKRKELNWVQLHQNLSSRSLSRSIRDQLLLLTNQSTIYEYWFYISHL